MSTVAANDALKTASCPICGTANGEYLRRGYYVKCSTCHVAFREQLAPAAELEEYWQNDFWTKDEIARRKNREPVFRDAFNLLHERKAGGGSVLDIGCGIGTFLAVCREAGWQVTGVEPSTTACEVAEREYGLQLIDEAFSSAMFGGQKFDAVFAAQVLHHLPDPAAFLAEVDEVLADDGILMLRTPNLIPLEFSLPVQRLLGREKEFFCGPALYAFHPRTLSLLFQKLQYVKITFVNSRPYLEPSTNQKEGSGSPFLNPGRLLVNAIKLTTYAAVQLVQRVSGGRMVVGPSIFVLAQKVGRQN